MTRQQTIETFLEALSSRQPVPGGGGASAFAGALGTALGLMVGNLTVGKKKYAAVEADVSHMMPGHLPPWRQPTDSLQGPRRRGRTRTG